MKYIFYIINCFKFLCYLVAHKVRVYNEGKKIGLSLKRRLMHDMSKLRPSEFFRFVEIKYGPTPKNNEAYYKTYYKVLTLHYSRNKHHPEYWKGARMDKESVLELIADLRAMARYVVKNKQFSISLPSGPSSADALYIKSLLTSMPFLSVGQLVRLDVITFIIKSVRNGVWVLNKNTILDIEEILGEKVINTDLEPVPTEKRSIKKSKKQEKPNS